MAKLLFRKMELPFFLVLLFVCATQSTEHPAYTPGGTRDLESCYREDIFKDCADDHLTGDCDFRTVSAILCLPSPQSRLCPRAADAWRDAGYGWIPGLLRCCLGVWRGRVVADVRTFNGSTTNIPYVFLSLGFNSDQMRHIKTGNTHSHT